MIVGYLDIRYFMEGLIDQPTVEKPTQNMWLSSYHFSCLQLDLSDLLDEN